MSKDLRPAIFTMTDEEFEAFSWIESHEDACAVVDEVVDSEYCVKGKPYDDHWRKGE